MLEESYKAVEAPVTSRQVASRSPWDLDGIYSSTNRAYSRGVSATSEVLYTDTLVCEDAATHGRALLRVPSDYEKSFNTVQLREVDAVQQARGVPDSARRLYQSMFQGTRVGLMTRAGPSDPVEVARGAGQGSVSGPELSRPSQEPILTSREMSSARYTTHNGREIAVAGYVDDSEHYGNGISDLPALLKDLEAGSEASGVGFAWDNFYACATDWDVGLQTLPVNTGITPHGARVEGWDIWRGGMVEAELPRALPDKVEKLLGKRRSVLNKHSLAITDLLSKLTKTRVRLARKGCSWDERVNTMQWIVGGSISYAPLIGIPDPSSLHQQDTEYMLMLLRRIGVRSTAERMSLVASRRLGGVQAPSVVEMMVSAVASDFPLLLNGNTTVSLLARDSLRDAMLCDPMEANEYSGMVTRALRFLSTYGIYATVSTDRFVSRVLENLRGASRIRQSMVGRYMPAVAAEARTWCRVGYIANEVRRVLATMRDAGVPYARWDREDMWRARLREAFPRSPRACAEAVGRARADSIRDWSTECVIFKHGEGCRICQKIGARRLGKTRGLRTSVQEQCSWMIRDLRTWGAGTLRCTAMGAATDARVPTVTRLGPLVAREASGSRVIP